MIRTRTNSFDVIFRETTLSIVDRSTGKESRIDIPNEEARKAILETLQKAELKTQTPKADAPKAEAPKEEESTEKEIQKTTTRSRKKKVE